MPNCNAPVICNPAPPRPGNSGDFDFPLCTAQVEALPCGDTLLVKALNKAWVDSTAIIPQSFGQKKNRLQFHGSALQGQCSIKSLQVL